MNTSSTSLIQSPDQLNATTTIEPPKTSLKMQTNKTPPTMHTLPYCYQPNDAHPTLLLPARHISNNAHQDISNDAH
jgi:hypothetical protein